MQPIDGRYRLTLSDWIGIAIMAGTLALMLAAIRGWIL